MFTGLIHGTATVVSIEKVGAGKACWIRSSLTDFILGESIALNGTCTTVCEFGEGGLFKIELLEETLKKTTFGALQIGDVLNVERSLTLSDRLGGHWVTGHIDGMGKILSIKKDEVWTEIKFEYPQDFAALMVEKGSIAVDGISLTVGNLTHSTFTCFLIPHTLQQTNLGHKKDGDFINLEFDLVGKYIQRRLEVKNEK